VLPRLQFQYVEHVVVPATALNIRLIICSTSNTGSRLYCISIKVSKAPTASTGKLFDPLIIVIPELLQDKVAVPGGDWNQSFISI
jgi:hypothetical protein